MRSHGRVLFLVQASFFYSTKGAAFETTGFILGIPLAPVRALEPRLKVTHLTTCHMQSVTGLGAKMVHGKTRGGIGVQADVALLLSKRCTFYSGAGRSRSLPLPCPTCYVLPAFDNRILSKKEKKDDWGEINQLRVRTGKNTA